MIFFAGRDFSITRFSLQWIWEDNMQFLQDKNIFEHTYFGFMWQMCGYIPTTLPKDEPERVPLTAAKLSASFVLETLIHAKEKVLFPFVYHHSLQPKMYMYLLLILLVSF